MLVAASHVIAASCEVYSEINCERELASTCNEIREPRTESEKKGVILLLGAAHKNEKTRRTQMGQC